jgi:hypothetical protein
MSTPHEPNLMHSTPVVTSPHVQHSTPGITSRHEAETPRLVHRRVRRRLSNAQDEQWQRPFASSPARARLNVTIDMETEELSDIQEDMIDSPAGSTYEPSQESLLAANTTSSTVNETVVSPVGENFIVSREQLWSLLEKCPKCGGCCMVDVCQHVGAYLSVVRSCYSCNVEERWNSHAKCGQLAQCNLLLSAALHFCGAPVRKTLRIFSAIGVQVPSEDTYLAHLSGILQPTTWMVWQQQQADLFSRLRHLGGALCLTGDMRADSPGHCAKYGTYTIIETRVKKIIHFELVQVSR